jgi:uncharacterized protein (DUF1499 family)
MARVRDVWSLAALAASVLAVVWFLAAAFGSKYGLIDWRFGFGTMTMKMGPLILYGASAIAAAGLVLSLAVRPFNRQALALSFVAVVIPVAMLVQVAQMRAQARAIPPIHDVTTDPADPPAFSPRAAAERAKVEGVNDLAFNAGTVAAANPLFGGLPETEAHRRAYGDLAPLISDIAPADIFEIVVDAAQAQPGWTVVELAPREGRVEAEVRSFWFGFVDDVVIRVRPISDGTGSAVDVRSVSRVGRSDLGANARRIRAYLADLNRRLAEAATGG